MAPLTRELERPPMSPSLTTPAGNLKLAKDRTAERIGGIVALVIAIGRAMVAQEEPRSPVALILK
jgi:hypothetical protein